MVRFLSALGVVLGSLFSILGYYGTAVACFCPTTFPQCCGPSGTTHPLSAYFFGYLGGAVAVISAIILILSFVRPHMALDGQTPAEAAGIDLNLEENRWMQLIRAAKRNETGGESVSNTSPHNLP